MGGKKLIGLISVLVAIITAEVMMGISELFES